ncbi:hypothetical protein V8E36_005206 [Tilletia maclaganii]
MAPPPDSYTGPLFGGLPSSDGKPRLPGHFHLIDWELNPLKRELRLSIAHQNAAWRNGKVPQAAIDVEGEIFAAARNTFPNAIEQARAGAAGQIEGTKLVFELKDGNSGPEATFEADWFRQTVVDELIHLGKDGFAGIPRVDISAIKDWVSRMDSDKIWQVAAQLSPNAEPISAVLKTTDLADSEELPGWTAEDRKEAQHRLKSELKNLIEIPPHVNLRPAPLALVTIQVKSKDNQTAATPEGNTQTKLIGFLTENMLETRPYNRNPLAAAKVNRSLGFALDVCRGVHHLAVNGFYHPSLKLDNTLIRRVDDEGDFAFLRAIVIDLEDVSHYRNEDGPVAPEALGKWSAYLGDDDKLRYEASKGPSRTKTIYKDLAGLPEARERLLIFSLGSTLAHFLHLRIHVDGADFGKTPKCLIPHYVVTVPVQPGADPILDAWEALLPIEVRNIVQQCVANDPMERPLLVEVIQVLEGAFTRLDTGVGEEPAFAP